MERPVLAIDAAVNLALGVLLVIFPGEVVEELGLPMVEQSFYPSILGGVLIGIAIALLADALRATRSPLFIPGR